MRRFCVEDCTTKETLRKCNDWVSRSHFEIKNSTVRLLKLKSIHFHTFSGNSFASLEQKSI